MKKILVIVLLLTAAPARAGILDMDYIRPSPTKALLYSAILTGGGYFYLAEQSPKPNNKYNLTGVLYLGASIAAIALIISHTSNDPFGGALMGTVALVGIRITEFGGVTTDAERDRHTHFKLLTIQDKLDEARRAQQALESKQQ